MANRPWRVRLSRSREKVHKMAKLRALDLAALIGSVAVSQLAGAIGSVFTVKSIPGWYATIAKPSFSPPNWVFGPVWATLYTLMGLAAWLVWRQRGTNPNVRAALVLFAVQLVLNAVWSIIFFGAHAIGWAFVEIVALWIAILLTTVWFFRVSHAAGILMIPYLLWVSFAAVLNFSLWRLNS